MRWGKRYTFLLLTVSVCAGILITHPYWQPRLFDGYFAREKIIGTLMNTVAFASGLVAIFKFVVDLPRFFKSSPAQREKAFKPDEILDRTSPEKIIEAYVGSRGGKVAWVDRGVGVAQALRAQRRVALVGRMKSGKSREAAEVLRCALAEEWVLPQQAYDLTRALQPFQPDLVKDYLSRRIDRGAPSFFYINDLPAQFPLTGLEGLEAALEVLAQCPRAHLLVTARSDQLSPAYRAWLVKHGFAFSELPRLTAEQCADLVRKAAEALNLTLDEAAVQVFVEHSDGTTGQPLLALLRMVNTGILSAGEEEARPYARTSLQESWAEVRAELTRQDALVASVLQALAVFWRANVPARRELVRLFAAQLARRHISHKRFAMLENLLKWYDFGLYGGDYIFISDAAVENLAPVLDEAQDELLAFFISLIPPRWLRRFVAKDKFRMLVETLFDFGNLLFESCRFDQAEAAWRNVLKVNPQYDLAWTNIGLLLSEKGLLEEAESAYHNALQVDPLDAIAWNDLGLLLQRQGRLEEAEVAYRNVLRIDSHFAPAWANFGVLLHDMGKEEEAEVAYRSALKADSYLDAAWLNLGVLLMQRGKSNEAEAALRRTLDVNPQYAPAWTTLGLLLRERKAYDEARQVYLDALSIFPEDANLHAGLGFVYLKIGEAERADYDFSEARRLNENTGLYDRACILALCGDAEGALALLREVLEAGEVDRAWVRLDPDWLEFCEDPRWLALVNQP